MVLTTGADVYTQVILDYYRHPRNAGTIKDAQIKIRDLNPLCGDAVEMHVRVRDNTIEDVKFSGSGCAISQAAASMLTEMAMGKQLADVKDITKEMMLDTLGIPISPVRLKCALLGLKVLKTGVYAYLGEKREGEFW